MGSSDERTDSSPRPSPAGASHESIVQGPKSGKIPPSPLPSPPGRGGIYWGRVYPGRHSFLVGPGLFSGHPSGIWVWLGASEAEAEVEAEEDSSSWHPAFVFGEDGGDAGEEVQLGEVLDAAGFGGDLDEAKALAVLVEIGDLFDGGELDVVRERGAA